MDLDLVMAELRPGENVSPDMSSYNKMVNHWRGSGLPPTLQEVTDKWLDLEANFVKQQQESVLDKELAEAGADTKAKTDALWEKLMDADSTKANALKVVIDTIKP